MQIQEKILSKNDQEAMSMRQRFAAEGLFVVNLMSSPGSGKTTLLEQLAQITTSFSVIEGDLQTNRDAQRLQAVGISAHQISTGDACHLEASMIKDAFGKIHYRHKDFLFIENVGNLVCPASYNLGANINIVALSITEGDDKILKYPTMFLCADAVILTKIDLLPYFDFSFDQIKQDLAQLGKHIPILQTSHKDKQSIQNFFNYLNEQRNKGYVSSHTF